MSIKPEQKHTLKQLQSELIDLLFSVNKTLAGLEEEENQPEERMKSVELLIEHYLNYPK